jgi:hypothetical protein
MSGEDEINEIVNGYQLQAGSIIHQMADELIKNGVEYPGNYMLEFVGGLLASTVHNTESGDAGFEIALTRFYAVMEMFETDSENIIYHEVAGEP